MASVLLVPPGQIVSPLVPQTQNAVAANFERFDGLTLPTTNPAGAQDGDAIGLGWAYGFDQPGRYPRPGAVDTPPQDQTYTPGPLRGVVGTVGGQPVELTTRNRQKENYRASYTKSRTPSIQFRKGVGQANQGAAQTVTLSEITSNPPQPGDLTSIIAGLA